MQHVTAISTREKKSLGLDKPPLVSLYTEPPQEELTLDEFELLSLDRLQLLRSVELLKTRGFEDKDLNGKIRAKEKQYLFSKKDITARLSEEKRDQISHFILRLAYCRSEDLRRWFITQECALFKYRLDEMTDAARELFMHQNGLEFDILSVSEKTKRMDKLTGLAGVTEVTCLNTTFYKVPFQQALSLIANRTVYLEAGFAYVPLHKLVSIITTRFRMHLSRALVEAANMFDVVSADTRIGPLLKNMNKQFIGNDFGQRTSSVDKLSPDQIEAAAETHMPLCMKNLHNGLKREHKLKHWGRLQYTLFLKGAGLDLEGALQFMESHFAKIMAHDQFVKSYSYSFRHMFGKEGARKNYTPYSCMKIIMGNPPEPGAYHGCPYRHMPDGQLNNLFASLKLSSNDIKDIVGLAKTSNYQLACQKHFDITHPGHLEMDLKISDSVANHPNQWFQASVNYHKLKSGKSLPEAPTLSSVPVAAEPSTTAT